MQHSAEHSSEPPPPPAHPFQPYRSTEAAGSVVRPARATLPVSSIFPTLPTSRTQQMQQTRIASRSRLAKALLHRAGRARGRGTPLRVRPLASRRSQLETSRSRGTDRMCTVAQSADGLLLRHHRLCASQPTLSSPRTEGRGGR